MALCLTHHTCKGPHPCHWLQAPWNLTPSYMFLPEWPGHYPSVSRSASDHFRRPVQAALMHRLRYQPENRSLYGSYRRLVYYQTHRICKTQTACHSAQRSPRDPEPQCHHTCKPGRLSEVIFCCVTGEFLLDRKSVV